METGDPGEDGTGTDVEQGPARIPEADMETERGPEGIPEAGKETGDTSERGTGTEQNLEVGMGLWKDLEK